VPRLPKYDPLDVPASKEDINRLRDELEVAPVTVLGHYIDFDEKSEKRMVDAIALWDELGEEVLAWTMADNSEVQLSKPQLEDILVAARIARGTRALALHQRAKQFKAQGGTLRDLQDWRDETPSKTPTQDGKH